MSRHIWNHLESRNVVWKIERDECLNRDEENTVSSRRHATRIIMDTYGYTYEDPSCNEGDEDDLKYVVQLESKFLIESFTYPVAYSFESSNSTSW